MKLHLKLFWMALVAIVFISCEKNSPADVVDDDEKTDVETDIEYWLTTGSRSSLLQRLDVPVLWKESGTALPTIVVDTTQRFQTMDGFGYTLTGGSAYLLH